MPADPISAKQAGLPHPHETADQHIERAEQRRGVKTATGESKWRGVRVQKVLRRATHAERLLQCDAVR